MASTASKNNKIHQTTLRLNESDYQKLQKMMADGRSMSDILTEGIEIEYDFYNSVQLLIKTMPDFESKADLDQWSINNFKNQPALLAKYSKAIAINAHTKVLTNLNDKYQLIIDEFDTFNYVFRTIGNNINQIAKKYNAGADVPMDALKDCTKSVIQLNDIVDAIRKKVEKNGVC